VAGSGINHRGGFAGVTKMCDTHARAFRCPLYIGDGVTEQGGSYLNWGFGLEVWMSEEPSAYNPPGALASGLDYAGENGSSDGLEQAGTGEEGEKALSQVYRQPPP
jgi:hypothetical protein